jgi:hypothetical protein
LQNSFNNTETWTGTVTLIKLKTNIPSSDAKAAKMVKKSLENCTFKLFSRLKGVTLAKMN